MRIHRLEQRQRLPISLETAWDYFSSPANLNEITPPELGFRITSPPEPAMYEGQIITYRVKVAPLIWIGWVTEIKSVVARRTFIDEQRFGPYKFWHHRHVFEETDGGVIMTDVVHYAMPFGCFGALAHVLFVRSKLKRIFDFRRRMLEERFGKPA